MTDTTTVRLQYRQDGRVTFAASTGSPVVSAADALAVLDSLVEHREELQAFAERERRAAAFRHLGELLASGLPQPRNVYAADYNDRVDVDLRSTEDVQAWVLHLDATSASEERGYGKLATRLAFTTDSGLHVSSPWVVSEEPQPAAHALIVAPEPSGVLT